MPVLVVPADTSLGVPLVQALARLGGEVRAYASGAGDVGAVRAAGAFVAVGDLDDEGRLDAAMTDVHTVIALHVDPLADAADTLDHHLHVTLTAAEKAEVGRLVVRSVPAAGAGGDPLREIAAGMERRLAELPLPTVSVRTSLVDTPELRDAAVSVAAQLGDPTVPVDPLHPDDVVAALVALDEARGSATGHATFRLHGEPLTLEGWLDHVGRELVGRVWTPAGRFPLLLPSLDTSWRDTDDRTADLFDFADIRPRALPT